MGIFDIIELKGHCQSIGEYVLYMETHKDEFDLCHTMIADHLKKMITILDKLEKSP